MHSSKVRRRKVKKVFQKREAHRAVRASRPFKTADCGPANVSAPPNDVAGKNRRGQHGIPCGIMAQAPSCVAPVFCKTEVTNNWLFDGDNLI